jgi:hypothetical protein
MYLNINYIIYDFFKVLKDNVFLQNYLKVLINNIITIP